MPLLKIIATATTDELAPDDEDVPGEYGVDVLDDVPVSRAGNAALDCFHEHIGIKCLDDFEIDVVEWDGGPVDQDDGVPGYSLGHRADFLGRVLPPDEVAP